MRKLIFPDAFNFDQPTARLVPLHSRGVDHDFIRKTASAFDKRALEFERRPGHEYIHLISVGAMETYACNNNADAFNRTHRKHAAYAPGPGCEKVIDLDGGLDKYHNATFRKIAACFKNHKNMHSKAKPSGYIVDAVINDDMDRGELLVGLDSTIWRRELQKLASEEPIYFSMGADMASDVCSYCNNRATSRKKYCEHLRKYARQTAEDGTQVCAISDAPYFHDISGVPCPADKICFGLRKVASEDGGTITGAELADIFGVTPAGLYNKRIYKAAEQRMQLLRKLAKIEKEMLTMAQPLADGLCAPFTEEAGYGRTADDKVSKLSEKDLASVLGSLKRHKVLLPMDLFLKLIMGDQFDAAAGDIPAAKRLLPDLFQSILESEDPELVTQDGSYEPEHVCNGRLDEDVRELVPELSLQDEPVRVRAIKAVLNGQPNVCRIVISKQASQADGPRLLADEYGKYLLSFASDQSDAVLRLTAASKLATVG